MRNGVEHFFSGAPTDVAGACETIIVHTDLGYKANNGGQVGRGYFGGQGNVLSYAGPLVLAVPESTHDVTPASLANTKIGPAGNPCTDTDDFIMNNLNYTLSAADIAAGAVAFKFDYAGGHTLINDCSLPASGSTAASVGIAAHV